MATTPTEIDPASVQVTATDGKAKAIEGRSPWELFRARLLKDKPTLVVLGIVVFALVLAVLAPLLWKLGVINPTKGDISLLNIEEGSIPKAPWGGISAAHPFGVEPGTGADVLSRVIVGVSLSLVISLAAAFIAVGLGTVLGIVAGYSRGWVDFALSRLIDLTLTFPQTLMLIALSGVAVELLKRVLHLSDGALVNGLYVALVLGIFGWPGFARIIRGQVLSLREREFVEAARSLGAKPGRIYFKELLPNLWAPVLVYFTLLLPSFISAEAALSYLGVGIKPPMPTLGNILADSVNYADADPVFFTIPALVIATLVLSLNLLGDGLRDALDPKSNR